MKSGMFSINIIWFHSQVVGCISATDGCGWSVYPLVIEGMLACKLMYMIKSCLMLHSLALILVCLFRKIKIWPFFNRDFIYISPKKFIHFRASRKMQEMKPLFSSTVYTPYHIRIILCLLFWLCANKDWQSLTSADRCDLPSYCCFDSYFNPFSPQKIEIQSADPCQYASRLWIWN